MKLSVSLESLTMLSLSGATVFMYQHYFHTFVYTQQHNIIYTFVQVFKTELSTAAVIQDEVKDTETLVIPGLRLES